jgi:hypothetical protein
MARIDDVGPQGSGSVLVKVQRRTVTTQQEIDDFKAHPLWDEIANTLVALTNRPARTADDRATVRRAKTTLDYLAKYKAFPPELLPSGRLIQASGFQPAVAAIRNQIEGWDESAAMLPPTTAAIDESCDTILNGLSSFTWPPMQREQWTAAMQAAAEAYRTGTEGALVAAQLGLAGVDTQIRASHTVLEDSQIQAQASAAEAAAARAEIAALAATQDEVAKTKLQTTTAEILAAAEAQRTELQGEAKTYLDGLRANYDTGNALIKKIGDQSVGGEYLNFAKREHWSYRIWSGLGILGVLVAFLFLLVVFVGPLTGTWIKATTGTDNVLLKLGISLSVAGFSVFAFREAGKHQRQSVEARYRALDVVALPPFVRDLTEPQQQQLRFLMGERLFGSTVEGEVSKRRRKGTDNSFTLNVEPESLRAIKDLATGG